MVIDEESYAYLKKISKFVENRKLNKNIEVSNLSGINFQLNCNLYDLLYEKLSKSKYSKKMSSQILVFEKGKDKFVNLSLEDQCTLLSNALVLFACRPGDTDLTLIGGAGRAGTYKFSGNITKIENIFLINQSITGIFENKINLAAL